MDKEFKSPEIKSAKEAHKRSYPPIYEKVVPVVLGAIALAIAILVVISILVALGQIG